MLRGREGSPKTVRCTASGSDKKKRRPLQTAQEDTLGCNRLGSSFNRDGGSQGWEAWTPPWPELPCTLVQENSKGEKYISIFGFFKFQKRRKPRRKVKHILRKRPLPSLNS